MALRVVPGRILCELGGLTITPPVTTCTADADASISSPFLNRIVSAALVSAASWRKSTLARSDTDFTSQRAHRVSSAVTHATPFSRVAAEAIGNGAQNANTVRGI